MVSPALRMSLIGSFPSDVAGTKPLLSAASDQGRSPVYPTQPCSDPCRRDTSGTVPPQLRAGRNSRQGRARWDATRVNATHGRRTLRGPGRLPDDWSVALGAYVGPCRNQPADSPRVGPPP